MYSKSFMHDSSLLFLQLLVKSILVESEHTFMSSNNISFLTKRKMNKRKIAEYNQILKFIILNFTMNEWEPMKHFFYSKKIIQFPYRIKLK